jgi:hypothetical protein
MPECPGIFAKLHENYMKKKYMKLYLNEKSNKPVDL